MNYINVKLKSPDPRDEIQNEIIDDDGSYYRATYYTNPTNYQVTCGYKFFFGFKFKTDNLAALSRDRCSKYGQNAGVNTKCMNDKNG